MQCFCTTCDLRMVFRLLRVVKEEEYVTDSMWPEKPEMFAF